MFFRKKTNASGSISIQIVQKVKGKNNIIKVIGSSHKAKEFSVLYSAVIEEIKLLLGTTELLFNDHHIAN